MKKYSNFIKMSILVFICLSFVGCKKEQISEERPQETKIGQNVWLTYWDTKAIDKELDYWKEKIKGINYFAAYFDQDRQLFIPFTITNIKTEVEVNFKEEEWISYLTIVNDQALVDGGSILKDTALLKYLFEDQIAMEGHIKEILTLVREGGYDGIEIDYEGIKSDKQLWNQYLVFLDKLYEKAKDYEMPVRVLLEPSTPINELDFPQGPEYIMMCYNLFGYGTSPGPKANKNFLLELVERMKQVSNERGYALATGGFDFREDGSVKALNTQEALALLKEQGEVPYREEDSRSIVFRYEDEEKFSHEVWYADEETLSYWESVLREVGERNISIWRLGSTIIE